MTAHRHPALTDPRSRSRPRPRPRAEGFLLSRRRFVAVQVGAVALLVLGGAVFTLYPTLVGLDLAVLEQLARNNAEDPALAGAAPPGQRLHIAVFGALGLFNLNEEGSLATWWSSFNLAVAAALCVLVARRAAADSRLLHGLWLGLGVAMLCLSIDEVAQIHDRVNKTQFVVGVLFEGMPSRPWVIFGGLFAALVALASVPLLLALPRRVAALIVLSGGLFVAGALGFEIAAAGVEDGGASLYALPVMGLILVEESLEMAAIALFNIVLFTCLMPPGVTLRFRRRAEAEPVAEDGTPTPADRPAAAAE